MGVAERSVVTFRIFGDGLVPSEITSSLGCEPTEAYSKGDVRIGRKTGQQYVQKTGRWSLAADDQRPEYISTQIMEILDKLTNKPAVWNNLKSKYVMDFFCGVFMSSSNDGLEFTSELLGELSKRGIALNLDIYDRSDD